MIPKESEKYRRYNGDIYEVVTIIKDPNHWFKKDILLRGKSGVISLLLKDFYGWKILDNGEKVKRFTKINLENKLDA